MNQFYDRKGEPVAYTEDGVHVYLFSGMPAAYIEADCLFDYDGRHLGWYQDGWVIGEGGRIVYFTDAAQGGLPRPPKKMGMLKSKKLPLPMKKERMMKNLRPMRSLDWAGIEGVDFFAAGIRE